MSRFKGERTVQWTALANAASVTGTSQYAVDGRTCIIDVNAGFTSATAGTARIIVAAGGLPAAVCPSATRSGWFSLGTVMGRIAVGSDGSVTCIPLTGTATGAVGTVVFFTGI